MANRKFYWLKLQKDFFKRHDIQIIESMPNGKEYILFYLKLLAESVSHDGELRFSETIPYDENMLSVVTNTNIDVIRSAMKIFTELHMIEILSDQTIFMAEVTKMIGSETSAAIRKRKSRENQSLLSEKCDIVTPMSQNGHTEIEKEIDIEIEKEVEGEKKSSFPSKNKKNSNPFLDMLKDGE